MCGSLSYLGKASNMFNVFVETGTYMGDTTKLASSLFKKVYTIELSKEIFESTRHKLEHLSNITFINGDSASEIDRVCNIIDSPAVFFLDAHYAGGKTAFGAKEVPLYEEINSIAKRNWCDLIILDDLRLFGRTGESGSDDSKIYPKMTFDWRDITLDGCCDIFNSYKKNIEIITSNDRVYILKKGDGLRVESVAELGIERKNPIYYTALEGISNLIAAETATNADGVVFDSEYGDGIAITPGPIKDFSMSIPFECDDGEYDLWSFYASAERRPLSIIVDDKIIATDLCGDITGGWYPEHLKWKVEARLRLSQGVHDIKILRTGWFPHLAGFALVKVGAM